MQYIIFTDRYSVVFNHIKPMNESYSLEDMDIDLDLDNNMLFDLHVAQGHSHLHELDKLLSHAYSNFDLDE